MAAMAERTVMARAAALFVAAVGVLSLALQVSLSAGARGSLGASLVYLSQFFTILTNVLVVVVMAAIGFGRRVPPVSVGAVVVAILGVGIVYHLLLAHLWELDGLEFYVDHGLHTVVPTLTLVWWLVFGDMGMRWRDPFFWIAWPLAYCLYALARAQVSGFYPYPFLNVDALGWDGVAWQIAALAGGFLLIGFAVVLAAHIRADASDTD